MEGIGGGRGLSTSNDDSFIDVYGFKYDRRVSAELIDHLSMMEENDNGLLRDEWEQYIHNKCQGDINNLKRFEHDKSFQELVNGGIASCVRKNVWLTFLDSIVLDDFKKAHYEKVLKDDLPQRNYQTEITLDLERTFPSHILSGDTEFKDKIHRILLVYSINNPSIGYCQSLNYITFMLLLIIENEEQAFWCLNSIAEKILPQYFTHTMVDAQIDQQVFHDLMQEMFPELTAHFKTIGVVIPIITIEWFLCLFSTILPAQHALVIWDNLFIRGSKVLLEVGLALIEANIDNLMKAKSHAQVVSILSFKNSPSTLFGTIRSSQKRIGIVISRKKVQDLKLKHWQITKKQVKENADQKDMKYLMKYTSFSLDKLKELKEEFDVLSHDGTGIGPIQFHQIILRFLPDWKESEKVLGKELNRLLLKMFEAMDEDNDKILNFKELVKGITILSHGSFDQKLRLIFKSFAIQDKNYMTKIEFKSMIDHVHCIFYKQHYQTIPQEVTDELEKNTENLLANLEDKVTFENLKQISQEYPLILESFQTPDHLASETTYTSSGSEPPILKRRSNSFHLLDEDRLSLKDKFNQQININQQQINNNNNHNNQNNNNLSSNSTTQPPSTPQKEQQLNQFIKKITQEPLIKRIHKPTQPPPPTIMSTPTKEQIKHYHSVTPASPSDNDPNNSSFTFNSPHKSTVNLSTVINEKPCTIM